MRICYTTKGEEFYVDDEDYERVNKYTWHIEKAGYLVACVRYKQNRLHRFVLNAYKGIEIDHIDGNKLNNQKSNLRICTHADNTKNRFKHRCGTKKYKGTRLQYPKSPYPWASIICCNYQIYYLGSYATEREAALAYNSKAIELHGEYAKLNIIE